MLSKRRLSPIFPVLSCARSVYTFVVFEMFFEALNLRPYTVKVTIPVQKYEVRNNKPV
jgi:hypothetical protein